MRLKEHFQNFVIVSVAYITAYSLTLGFVAPVQKILMSSVAIEVGLLFLPHGVRVLAIYFLGWKAVFYLLPASYLMMVLSAQAGIDLNPWLVIVSPVACYIGFELVARFLPERTPPRRFPRWQYFGVIAFVSSVLNSLGITLVFKQELDLLVATGYLMGDMAGFFVCFLILMYAFRFARLLAKASET